MKFGFRNVAVATAVAAMALTSFQGQASAGGKEAGAFLGGLLLGGALGAQRPVYAQPAPVYVQPRPVYVQPQPVYVQPRCTWQNVQVYDPYVGAYVYRRQQVCG